MNYGVTELPKMLAGQGVESSFLVSKVKESRLKMAPSASTTHLSNDNLLAYKIYEQEWVDPFNSVL